LFVLSAFERRARIAVSRDRAAFPGAYHPLKAAVTTARSIKALAVIEPALRSNIVTPTVKSSAKHG
jgi:hypothetical protein